MRRSDGPAMIKGDATTKNIPIIMITAQDDRDVRVCRTEQCREVLDG
jgi:hypothetical protein